MRSVSDEDVRALKPKRRKKRDLLVVEDDLSLPQSLCDAILDLPVRIGTSAGFAESLLEKMPQLMGPEFATVTGLVLYGDRKRRTHDFHENSSSGFKKFVAKFRSFL